MNGTVMELLLEAIWGKKAEDSVRRCVLQHGVVSVLAHRQCFLITIELRHSHLSSYCLQFSRRPEFHN
jgi:hypothetical protein